MGQKGRQHSHLIILISKIGRLPVRTLWRIPTCQNSGRFFKLNNAKTMPRIFQRPNLATRPNGSKAIAVTIPIPVNKATGDKANAEAMTDSFWSVSKAVTA